MKLTEKTVSGTEIYAGRILHVQVDRVQLPDGHESTREVIRHPGGVGVLALTDAGEVLLVQQYRYPYGEVLTEIPAGKREPDEEPLETGKRELEEETGYVADRYEPLGTVYPSPGYTDEVIHLFLAAGLHKTAAHTDEGEFLHVLRRPLAQLVDQVLAGELPDAKTQVAILKAWKKTGGKL
mgnify:CR=1 FL=1